MPTFSIVFMARTENVEAIVIPQEATWLFKIKCSTCGQAFPKEVEINRNEEVEMQKQHGVANFCIKCKNCERKGYLTILENSTYSIKADENGMIKGIFANVECRGLEISGIVMTDIFSVKVKESGTVFENADFSDLWCEYDDKISGVAQVEEQKFDIVRSKEK